MCIQETIVDEIAQTGSHLEVGFATALHVPDQVTLYRRPAVRRAAQQETALPQEHTFTAIDSRYPHFDGICPRTLFTGNDERERRVVHRIPTACKQWYEHG